MEKCPFCQSPVVSQRGLEHTFGCGSKDIGQPTPLCTERTLRIRAEKECAGYKLLLDSKAIDTSSAIAHLQAKILEYEKKMGPLLPVAPHIAKNYIYPQPVQKPAISGRFKAAVIILLTLTFLSTWSCYLQAKIAADVAVLVLERISGRR